MESFMRTLDVVRRRVKGLALLLLMAGLWWPGVSLAAPEVIGLRTGEHLGMTRFVLDLSEKVDFRVFTLSNPYRIVIDFPEMDWKIPTETASQEKGLIQSLRYGLFTPGTSRVVLDVAKPVAVKQAFLLTSIGPHGYRFVLDIGETSKEVFVDTSEAAALSAPLQATAPVAPPPVPQGTSKPLIVIDPGHGGVDPGALSRSGLLEKSVTLDVAKALKAELEATGRYRVMLTRERDIYIPLRERVAIARRAGADLFLSLHADSHPNRRTRGASVYTLSEQASDKEAAAIAARENKSDIIAGMDFSGADPMLTNILIDIVQRDSLNSSLNFANLLVQEMGKATRLVQNTRRSAGFAVLKAPDVPSVLVEMGYLSNREEEKLLQDSGHRSRLAAAVTTAVKRFFSERHL